MMFILLSMCGLSICITTLSLSPILFIISTTPENETNIIQSISRLNLPDRVETIVCSIQPGNVYSEHYPINILRNVGLMQSPTSYVLMIDSSKHLSRITYSMCIS